MAKKSKRKPRPKIPPKNELSYLLLTKRMSITDIAGRYTVTAITVREWLRKYKLRAKGVGRVRIRMMQLGYVSWDDVFRSEVRLTNLEIAEKLRCCAATIANRRREWSNKQKENLDESVRSSG